MKTLTSEQVVMHRLQIREVVVVVSSVSIGATSSSPPSESHQLVFSSLKKRPIIVLYGIEALSQYSLSVLKSNHHYDVEDFDTDL